MRRPALTNLLTGAAALSVTILSAYEPPVVQSDALTDISSVRALPDPVASVAPTNPRVETSRIDTAPRAEPAAKGGESAAKPVKPVAAPARPIIRKVAAVQTASLAPRRYLLLGIGF